jgi:dihydropteroate synthase
MGILNVTPDSFSDGGLHVDKDRAVARGIEMVDQGAAIIDVGPQSTRPGSLPVEPAEQIRRAVPVIEALAGRVSVPISIDTHVPEVARAALDAGARIINDITALSDDRMAELAAQRQVPVVLMHMQGTPSTMQLDPQYTDVVAQVRDFLIDRAQRAQALGIRKDRILIDPGIGFGKTIQHNLALLARIEVFVKTGYPVVVGPSRKAFIGHITGRQVPAERVFGTAACVALAAAAGVAVVRVHDVAQMADVVKVVNRIRQF